jgi:hypothetical protein
VVTCNHEIATMPHIAQTPTAPYYAVIFTSVHTEREEGCEITAQRVLELAAVQPGFLGVESASAECGITE